MVKLVLRENDNLEKALKRFRRQCNLAGIKTELKRRANYEKPSEKKRREKKEAVREVSKVRNKALKAKDKKKKKRKLGLL